MQKYAVEEGIEGDKALLLLPISAEGRKDYVLQERMYGVKEFQYEEWYAVGRMESTIASYGMESENGKLLYVLFYVFCVVTYRHNP